MTDQDQTYFNLRAALAVLRSDDLLCRHMEQFYLTPKFDKRNAELHAAGKAVALPLIKAALRDAREWKRKRRGTVYGPLVRALENAHHMLHFDDYGYYHRYTAILNLYEAANLCATILDAEAYKTHWVHKSSTVAVDVDPRASPSEMSKRIAEHIRAGKSAAEAVKAAKGEDQVIRAMLAEADELLRRATEQPGAAPAPPQPAPDPRREIDAMLAEIARTKGFDAARQIVRRAGVRSIASIPDKMTDNLIRACEKALGREHAEGQ